MVGTAVRRAGTSIGGLLAGSLASATLAGVLALHVRAVLADHVGAWQVDAVVEVAVTAVGALVAAWLAAGALVATVCVVVRAAGASWRAGERLVHRCAPQVVRKALVLAVGAGIGLGMASGATAAVPEPSASAATAVSPQDSAVPDDLGWAVSLPTSTPTPQSADVAGARSRGASPAPPRATGSTVVETTAAAHPVAALGPDRGRSRHGRGGSRRQPLVDRRAPPAARRHGRAGRCCVAALVRAELGGDRSRPRPDPAGSGAHRGRDDAGAGAVSAPVGALVLAHGTTAAEDAFARVRGAGASNGPTRPGGGRTRRPQVRLVPAVATPLVEEATGPAHAVPETAAGRIAVLRVSDRSLVMEADDDAPRLLPDGDPAIVARAVALASLEVLAGRRSVAQLARWLTPGVYESLQVRAGLTAARARHDRGDPAARDPPHAARAASDSHVLEVERGGRRRGASASRRPPARGRTAAPGASRPSRSAEPGRTEARPRCTGAGFRRVSACAAAWRPCGAPRGWPRRRSRPDGRQRSCHRRRRASPRRRRRRPTARCTAAARAARGRRCPWPRACPASGRRRPTAAAPPAHRRWRRQRRRSRAVTAGASGCCDLDLEVEQVADRLLLDGVGHRVEELEALTLVLDQRVALGHRAQADALLEVVHLVEVLAPLAVEDRQRHAPLELAHVRPSRSAPRAPRRRARRRRGSPASSSSADSRVGAAGLLDDLVRA